MLKLPPFTFTRIYVGLVVAGMVILLLTQQDTPFGGLALWCVTLPWNLAISLVEERLAPGAYDASNIPGLLVCLASAAINAGIIWKIESRHAARKASLRDRSKF